MTQNCRNCGSADLYTNPVQLENMARSNGMLAATWYFNLRVCVTCGLADWFLAKQDLDWVKRKFAPPVKSATPDVIEEVKAALNDGDKITAVKLYRSATGVGLSEAKESWRRSSAAALRDDKLAPHAEDRMRTVPDEPAIPGCRSHLAFGQSPESPHSPRDWPRRARGSIDAG